MYQLVPELCGCIWVTGNKAPIWLILPWSLCGEENLLSTQKGPGVWSFLYQEANPLKSSKSWASWPFRHPPRKQQDRAHAIQSDTYIKSRNESYFCNILLSSKISVTCFNVFIISTRQSRAATSHLTSGKMSPIKAKTWDGAEVYEGAGIWTSQSQGWCPHSRQPYNKLSTDMRGTSKH